MAEDSIRGRIAQMMSANQPVAGRDPGYTHPPLQAPSPIAAKGLRIMEHLGLGLRDWFQLPGKVFGTVPNDQGVTPEEMADWGAGTALGQLGMARLPGGMPAGAVGVGGAKLRPYENVPDSLMGFRRDAPTRPFEEQNWQHVQPVRVRFSNDVFEDAVKGLNQAHALERARRNWPGAMIEPIASPMMPPDTKF